MKPTNPVFDRIDRDKLQLMLAIREDYKSGLLTLEEARARIRAEVGKVSPEEFAAAEQLVKDEHPDECRDEDVQEIIQIFDGLIDEPLPDLPFGHPIDAYHREVKRMKDLVEQGKELLKKPFILNPWMELMEKIMQYKVHFSRKQNQLYAALERKGFTRPSTTMWTYDDYVKDEMNKAMDLLRLGNYDAFPEAFRTMSADMLDLIAKEEMILYPTSLKLISDAEFEEMARGDREIGFFDIDMPDLEKKETGVSQVSQGDLMDDMAALLARYGYGATNGIASDQILDVAEGKLTLEQINLLFRHLPVDISFVDENELVKFYTDTPHRVFPRSKGVIGREVRNCHPPKSVHLVEEIIGKFRNGEQSRAEFWINKPDVFIYIVYIAVRDHKGRFRGVMEMMQDCTHIRKLEGSRTLLTWEDEQQKSSGTDTTNEREDVFRGELTPDTKLKTLLKQYPKLIDDLPNVNPKFSMLKTPMAKVILPMATLKTMSERSGMPFEELTARLEKLITAYKKEQ